MRRRNLVRVLVPLAAIALLLAACGDGDSDSSSETTAAPSASTAAPASTEAPTETTAAPTTAAPTTAAPTTAAPTTAAPVVGSIEESFVGNVAVPYSAVDIGVGEIRVYFNNGTSGNIVAIYHGAGTADATDLCPGNSIESGGQFSNVSNAPLTEGACEGFPTDVGSVRICTGGVWLYQTMIPNDSVGNLYGSLEKRAEDGTIGGVTAVAANSPGTPEIDYSADAYTVSAMFTNDGSTEITCQAPLT